jgi:hypothetical protein
MVCRYGSGVKLTALLLFRPILALVLIMALTALTAGVFGYFLAITGKIWLADPLASRVATSHHVRFLTDLWAHLGSYASAFVGGLVMIVMVWRKRRESVQAGSTNVS